jgi:moderate conductance mechanosensitive channel
MYEGKRIVGVAGLAAAISLGAIILATMGSCGALAAPASQTAATSPKAHELLTLLAQEWLEEQGLAKPAAPAAQKTDTSVEDNLNSDAGAIHDQIMALAGAIPDLPNEFERAAARISAFDPDSGRAQFLLKLGIFGDRWKVATRLLAQRVQLFLKLAIVAAFGFGAQWLFRKMTGRVRGRLDGLPMDTVKDRLRVIAMRVALAFGVIAAFVLGSLGPFLTLDWDPVRREIILGFLIVFVAIWVAAAIGSCCWPPVMSVPGSFRQKRERRGSGAGD